jgi:hypothetical protein
VCEQEWWIDYSPPVGPVEEPSLTFDDFKRYISQLTKQYSKQFQIAFGPLYDELGRMERAMKPLTDEITITPTPNTRKTYGPQPRSTFSRNGRKNY